MNSITFYNIILLASFSFSAIEDTSAKEAFESEYVTRRALERDIPDLVDLINTQACKDSDKIVIVPEQFRTAYIRSAVGDDRMFVATHASNIIGFKKLFCITDNDERDDILANELRCIGGVEPVVVESVSLNGLKSQDASPEELEKLFSSPVTYIYNGADFTHPDHREKGLNSRLTKYALDLVTKPTADHVQRNKSTYVALVYGITQANSGKERDVLGGRSKGIVNQFIPFVKAVAQVCGRTPQSHVLLTRHHAFKPSFDPKAVECRPLSDDQAIAGYGCLLISGLEPKTVDASTHKDVAS